MDAMRTLVITLFFLFSFAMILWSEGISPTSKKKSTIQRSSQVNDVAYLEDVHFSMFSSSETKLSLHAKNLVENSAEGVINLNYPKGVVGEGEKSVQFSGDRGNVLLKKQLIKVYDSVMVRNLESNSTADELMINQQTQTATLLGNVFSVFSPENSPQFVLKSNKAYLNVKNSLGEYQENVSGQVKFKNEKLNPKINFKSNLLKVNLDKRVIDLKDKVYLQRLGMKINALEGRIWLKNYQSGVKYFTLFDDVRLLERLNLENGEEVYRKAFSEKIEGFPLERKLVLSGYPKVLQGRDVIKGNKIIIREQQELVEILNTNSRFYFEDEGQ